MDIDFVSHITITVYQGCSEQDAVNKKSPISKPKIKGLKTTREDPSMYVCFSPSYLYL